LANWFFDGARADVAKVVSANPAFQLTHAFALGSASKPASYNFGAIFANAQVCSIISEPWRSTDKQTFLQGGIDGQGVVTMRANQTWSGSDITKIQGQVCNGSLVSDRGQD